MSSLCKHKRTCNYAEKKDDSQIVNGLNIKDKDALMIHLLKQNNDLQNKITDIVSKLTNNHSFL